MFLVLWETFGFGSTLLPTAYGLLPTASRFVPSHQAQLTLHALAW